MKRILIYILSFFMVFNACKKDEEIKVQYGNILGVLQTKDNDKVSNASVTLSQNGDVIKQAITDKDGKFTFEKVPEGAYQLAAFHSVLKESEVFDYEVKGNTDHELTFVFYPSVSIKGTLVDENNAPIKGVIINLEYVSNKKSAKVNEITLTDDKGKFYFFGLDPGVYNVIFISQLWEKADILVRVEDGKEAIVVLTSKEIFLETFVDSRDGREYKQVEIGNQIWMAENLDYLPKVDHRSLGSYTDPYYYVYNYNPNGADENTQIKNAKLTDTYKTYGVLYNWAAAMAGEQSSNTNPSNVQGVCPDGWHLPSSTEWDELKIFVENGGGVQAGIALKSIGTIQNGTGLWNSNTSYKGQDLYSFGALPGGWRHSNGNWYNIKSHGFFQTSFAPNSNSAYSKYFYGYSSALYSNNFNSRFGLSVRCVKD